MSNRKEIRQCKFEQDNGCRCVYCGKQVMSDKCDSLRSRCLSAGGITSEVVRQEIAAKSKLRLGDVTEVALKSIGITEDRYKAAKELFGLQPTCNCQKRKDWLNKVSDWWAGESS